MIRLRKKKFRDKFPENPYMLENFEGSHNDSELFQFFKTHKGNYFTKWVHYFEIYESFLSKYKGKDVNILEIGVHKGGSLQMWQSYFGKNSKIFGVDISPACKKYENENTKIFIGDQSDRKFLKSLIAQLPTLDIVIDDGGHMSKQQINSFEEIYPHIAENGLYIVEDTHTNYWPKYQRGTRKSFIEYSKKLIDLLHAYHFDRKTFARYAIPHNKRVGQVNVPEFTKTTKSISFFDSMVVFQKAKINEPYHGYAGTGEKKDV
jgi:hypothetical protein